MISLHMGDNETAQAAPKVSVLVISYNCAEALRRCLESLERSLERDSMEVLVVDNGSLDGTPQLEHDFPRATFLRLPRNFGLVKALNIGLRTARGEFVMLLHPDTEVSPGAVTALAKRLESEPDAVAVCPLVTAPSGEPAASIRRLPSPQEILRAWREGGFPPDPPPDLSAASLPVGFASGVALMVRSYFPKGLRYIDERYGQHWADLELCFQIRRASRKILLVPAARVVHYGGLGLQAYSGQARAQLSADWALGAAVFAGKHYGWFAGFELRLRAILSALAGVLVSLVRMREVGYRFSLFSLLVSGQKVDGFQRGL